MKWILKNTEHGMAKTTKWRSARFGSTTVRVEASRLSNGITLVTAQSSTATETSLGIAIQDGPYNGNIKTSGTRHYLEHMIFKGSLKHAGDKIARHIEYNGGDIDANTLRECTFYYITAPSQAKARDFFELMASAVIHPRFSLEDVERERGVVLTELKAYLDDHDTQAENNMMRLLFPKNSFAHFPIEGYAQIIDSVQYEQLRTLHEHRCTARRMIVIGVGAIHHNEFRRLAERVLGELPPRRVNIAAQREPIYRIGQAKHIIEKQSDCASCVLIGFNTSPSIASESERDALLLIESALGSGMASRLFQSLREQRGIGYAPKADLSFSRSFSTFSVGTDCEKSEHITEAVETIQGEVRRLQEKRIASNELRGNIERIRHKTREGLRDVEILRDELLLCAMWKRPAHLFREYHTLPSLTPACIQTVACKYLTIDNCATVAIQGLCTPPPPQESDIAHNKLLP